MQRTVFTRNRRENKLIGYLNNITVASESVFLILS